ncbi:MAG: type II toxin-antitoxin system VapC family toxin [Thermodesulfovibrionales bacterium]|nr:type II toxin-antitoxin system VapC family toxin [Thermodesulfovibrionales bacterium]
MKTHIVDASVAAKWFTEEEYSANALALLNRGHELQAPDFFMLEMDGIICKWIRRGIINVDEGEEVRSTLNRVPLQKHPFGPLRDSAYSIAVSTGRSFYDCLYVALAALLKGRMVTADRKLYEALKNGPFKKHIVWVGNVG